MRTFWLLVVIAGVCGVMWGAVKHNQSDSVAQARREVNIEGIPVDIATGDEFSLEQVTSKDGYISVTGFTRKGLNKPERKEYIVPATSVFAEGWLERPSVTVGLLERELYLLVP